MTCLDLDYSEDSVADVDFNVVQTESGHFVEIQGTAEQIPFDRNQLNEILLLADKGIKSILKAQRAILALEESSP